MADILTSAALYRYRGELYRMLSVNDVTVRVLIDADASHDVFPDALDFGTSHDGPWVRLPLSSFEGAVDRRVTGLWNGAPVIVAQLYTTGPAVGRVKVVYDGSSAAEAKTAGFRGNQYSGWEKDVAPDEVEIVQVDLVEREGFGIG